MTEFTPEWIEEQKEMLSRISPLPWRACGCGKCGQISNKIDCVAKATIGDWGDDYPSIRRIGGSIEGRFETYMEQITYGTVSKDEGIANAKYIADACNNYPKALDEIQRLQAIIELADIDYESEHEAKENLQMATDTVIACLQSRVQELECQLKSKQIVIESKEQTIREFAEKMLDLRKR